MMRKKPVKLPTINDLKLKHYTTATPHSPINSYLIIGKGTESNITEQKVTQILSQVILLSLRIMFHYLLCFCFLPKQKQK